MQDWPEYAAATIAGLLQCLHVATVWYGWQVGTKCWNGANGEKVVRERCTTATVHELFKKIYE